MIISWLSEYIAKFLEFCFYTIPLWISLYPLFSKIVSKHIEQKTSHKLNQIQDSIKNDYARELEQVKSEHQRLASLFNTVNTAYLEAMKIGSHEQVNAIKIIWQDVREITQNQPVAFGWLDLLGYEECKRNTELVSDDMLRQVKKQALKFANAETDLVRPFIDEKTFTYITAYRLVAGRLSILISNIRNTDYTQHWREDDIINKALNSIFDEEEILLIKNTPYGINDLFKLIETKIATHLRKVMTGVATAKAIMTSLSELQRQETINDNDSKLKGQTIN
ncbi:MAG: hypothetical protein HRT35_07510 [Algicola sp.]|nr:hypothetical protein [Algicola sp.]